MPKDDTPKLKRFTKLELDDESAGCRRSAGKLTRFANLDIDGIDKPPRRRKKVQVAPAAGAPSRPVTPQAPPPPIEAVRRPLPSPPPRISAPLRRARPAQALGRDLVPPDAVPGMLTVEVDLGRGTRTERQTWHIGGRPTPGPRPGGPPRDVGRPHYNGQPPYPVRRAAHAEPPPPQAIELTPMAAHQVRLMARESGWLGCGLRIIASGAGSETDYDFVFEPRPEEGDEIIVSQGIPIFLDRRSLEALRGSRITYDDIPGMAGFRLG